MKALTQVLIAINALCFALATAAFMQIVPHLGKGF